MSKVIIQDLDFCHEKTSSISAVEGGFSQAPSVSVSAAVDTNVSASFSANVNVYSYGNRFYSSINFDGAGGYGQAAAAAYSINDSTYTSAFSSVVDF